STTRSRRASWTSGTEAISTTPAGPTRPRPSRTRRFTSFATTSGRGWADAPASLHELAGADVDIRPPRPRDPDPLSFTASSPTARCRAHGTTPQACLTIGRGTTIQDSPASLARTPSTAGSRVLVEGYLGPHRRRGEPSLPILQISVVARQHRRVHGPA